MDIILSTILTSNEYVLLQLILTIRERLKSRNKRISKEPNFTLQQNYLVSLLGCSPNTIVQSINKLYQLGVIEQVSNDFGACAEYRFNEEHYKDLIKQASKQTRILHTGRKKIAKEVPAKKIIDYIIGKSVKKND